MMEMEKPKIQCVFMDEEGTHGKFTVEPLERGYGHTIGNALRRVLLSSLEGTAVTSIKIDEVLHEFSTIPGVKEDITEIVLNLKDLVFKMEGDSSKVIYIENTTPIDPAIWHTFHSNGGFQWSDFNIIDRSFLKLRNLSLAYQIPVHICKKLRVDKIRLSLTAENILLWTPTENMYIDPEVSTFGNDIEAKFGEFAATPPHQTYVFGLSFSF